MICGYNKGRQIAPNYTQTMGSFKLLNEFKPVAVKEMMPTASLTQGCNSGLFKSLGLRGWVVFVIGFVFHPPLPPLLSQNSAGCLIFISQRQTHVVLSIFQPQQYHNRTDQSSGCYADFRSAKTILFQILNRISILSSVSISFSFLLIPLSHHMTFFTFISLCHTVPWLSLIRCLEF